MRKDRIYRVRLCAAVPANERLTTDVHAAHCICPAGLAGSRNHIAALLYALEDFVKSGLREEAAEVCTEKLNAWNRPRARKVKPREMSKVFLWKEFSKQGSKRLKIEKPHHDPRPMCDRLVVVEEVQGFVRNLSQAHIELEKINPTQVKQYDSSSWLKLLQPTPSPSSASSSSDSSTEPGSESSSGSEHDLQPDIHQLNTPADRTRESLYSQEVVLNQEEVRKLEETTRRAVWHKARRLRVTSTMAKDIACRKKPCS